jgi:hypothetical protein
MPTSAPKTSQTRRTVVGPGRSSAKRRTDAGDAQKKKLAALLLLVAVFVFFWTRRGGPDPAAAQTPMAVSEQTIETDTGSVRVPAIAGSARLVAAWQAQPIQDLVRNPFVSQQPPEELPEPVKPLADEGSTRTEQFWDRVSELAAERENREADRRRLRELVLRDAADIELQSILLGRPTRALVGGKLVEAGHELGDGSGFTVIAISAEGIRLERDGHRIRVGLQGRPMLEPVPVVPAARDEPSGDLGRAVGSAPAIGPIKSAGADFDHRRWLGVVGTGMGSHRAASPFTLATA